MGLELHGAITSGDRRARADGRTFEGESLLDGDEAPTKAADGPSQCWHLLALCWLAPADQRYRFAKSQSKDSFVSFGGVRHRSLKISEKSAEQHNF